MDFQSYIENIQTLYSSGVTTEHSFRPALVALFSAIDPTLVVINEPKHITDVGGPYFVFNRNDVAVGWCEAKDLGKEIKKFAATDYSRAQKERYKKGLPNLIYTNGIDFEFIRDGETTDYFPIAELAQPLITRPENYSRLETRLRDFASVTPISIKSSKRLAEMMAGKAAIIKDIMSRALAMDFKAHARGGKPTDLVGQYEAFRERLIHDITVDEFADIYAETIAYGLFAARLHDNTPTTFNRAEALDLLPKSNPFLRELFIYIAGPNLDERLRRVIDELCNLFCVSDMPSVLRNFGKMTAREDPFLHFYEVFLAEYNPAKRKARGVWYTPESAVSFIVRAVDDVLKTHFGVSEGLADTSRIVINWDTGHNDKNGRPATIQKSLHRVQILDPATGTGTFLAEVVKVVAKSVSAVAPGQWSSYVESDLIPRIHGFELLMASYAMCHMKLDMILTSQAYKPSEQPPRLGVYLTNSLEEGERIEQTLFGLSRAIAEEAKAASDIKRQFPIMCVIGNPPYSGISQNNGKWITEKIEDYKYIDGVHFGERKHWLQDDYVKFIRFAEDMINKTGEGILGFVTNHGYLDNPTFRGMRWHLMRSFDRIDVLDLHGNANKREVSPDGSPDKNIFDIRQGVAIILAIKRREPKSGLAEVWHGSLWGKREDKYDSLFSSGRTSLVRTKLSPREPYFMFYPANLAALDKYDQGFSISKLFISQSTGIISARDDLTVAFNSKELRARIQDFLDVNETDEGIRTRFFGSRKAGKKYLPGDSRGWKLVDKRPLLADKDWQGQIQDILYRPFDTRSIWYDSDIVDWPRLETMGRFRNAANVAMLTPRMTADLFSPLVSDKIISNKTASRYDQTYFFPLYIEPEDGELDQELKVNFRPKLFASIRKAAGLDKSCKGTTAKADVEGPSGDERPDELKIFDYIYGVLHSTVYRQTYAEFLKIDFPRIPFPSSPQVFANVSEQGELLRRLHLMDDTIVGQTPFSYQGEGLSVVEKPMYKCGHIWINGAQFFENVPRTAWDFTIGGYQPAQKWLKDRSSRKLSWNDVRHYQKIIKVLVETERIMREIDLPLV